MARTTRVPNRFASEGGVRQEGSLPLYICNGCGREVVWATSTKTGRKYLASCSPSASDGPHAGWHYRKHAVHRCCATSSPAATPAA